MGTHIIWRNPSPPCKRGFQVSRVTRNPTAAVYQAFSCSGFKHVLQLFRSHTTSAAAATTASETAVATASPRASLGAARW